jgi:hypothetical protein
MPKKIKSIDTNTPNYKQPSQFNVEKGIKPDKIDPKKIFDGYNNNNKNKYKK